MFFKEVRRLFSGEKLHECEVAIGASRRWFGLTLKRDRRDGELYVVVSLGALGSQNTQLIDAAGFDRLVEAVEATRAALDQARREKTTP